MEQRINKMQRTTTTTTATTSASNKRALSRVEGDTVVNVSEFRRYEIVSAFEEWGSAPLLPDAPEPRKGPFSLRLFMESFEDEEEHDKLIFGALDMDSPILFAKYEGVTYVGSNGRNPGSFDSEGYCIQQNTTGVSMPSLLAMFATPKEVFTASPPAFEVNHHIFWSAGFQMLASQASNMLRFRVFFSNPFSKSKQTYSFQETYTMHSMD